MLLFVQSPAQDDEKGEEPEKSAAKRRKRLHAVPIPFVLYSPMLAEMLLGSFTPKAIAAMEQDKLETMADTAINSGVWNAKVPASPPSDLVCLRS
jgi:hypothetical protein